MSDQHLTISHVDEQIHQIEQSQKNSKLPEDSSKHALGLKDICDKVQLAVPILKFLRAMLFFKPKWQTILDQVIQATSFCDLVSGSE